MNSKLLAMGLLLLSHTALAETSDNADQMQSIELKLSGYRTDMTSIGETLSGRELDVALKVHSEIDLTSRSIHGLKMGFLGIQVSACSKDGNLALKNYLANDIGFQIAQIDESVKAISRELSRSQNLALITRGNQFRDYLDQVIEKLSNIQRSFRQ
jgi:hypothetical protein